MLRWWMFIEEFGLFIPGEINMCADYFSQIELDPKILKEKSAGPTEKLNLEESLFQDIISDNLRLAECCVNVADNDILPLDYNRIAFEKH